MMQDQNINNIEIKKPEIIEIFEFDEKNDNKNFIELD